MAWIESVPAEAGGTGLQFDCGELTIPTNPSTNHYVLGYRPKFLVLNSQNGSSSMWSLVYDENKSTTSYSRNMTDYNLGGTVAVSIQSIEDDGFIYTRGSGQVSSFAKIQYYALY